MSMMPPTVRAKLKPMPEKSTFGRKISMMGVSSSCSHSAKSRDRAKNRRQGQISFGSASSSGRSMPARSSPSHLSTSRLSKLSPERKMSRQTVSARCNWRRSCARRLMCRSSAADRPSSPRCSSRISASGRPSARSSFSRSSSSSSASE